MTRKKALISITLTLSLIMSFALSALPAQALPINSNAYIANLADANFGNLEHGTLIATLSKKVTKPAAKKNPKPASKTPKKPSRPASKNAPKKPSGNINRSSSPEHKHLKLKHVDIHRHKVHKRHLDTGTKTTRTTQKHVNDPKTPVPTKAEAYFKSGKESGSVSVSNPSSKKMDAGHILARQSGGKGHVTDQVFPQDPSTNRGNGGKTDWRKQEDKFKKAVQKNGSGTQIVKLYK